MSSLEQLCGLASRVLDDHLDSDVSFENLNSETLNSNTFVEQEQPPNMNRRIEPLQNPGETEHPVEAEVVVVELSAINLMTKNRYVCEVCKKGFQRDQNLQLHRRGHNLPWKLKTTKSDTRKRVYLCPEETCPHHFRNRALGDMTGIKKHYLRKHCPKMYKCPKCSKPYAVLSDLKAHLKNCGKNKYRCDCGLIYGRRDTFRTHKAFCEVLAAETERVTASHPRLVETSSEEDSANGTMTNFAQGDVSPPPGFEHMHREHLNTPRSSFLHHQLPGSFSEPKHQNQLNDAPAPGFTSINHRHLQFTELANLSSALGYKGGPLMLNFSNNTAVKKESNIVSKNPHAFQSFPADFTATTGNYSHYTTSQPTTLQSYQQRQFDGDMIIGSIGMSNLQMGESSGHHNVAPPVNSYYYNLLMGDEKEPPTRDFLGLTMGIGGGASGASSTAMDDFIVALGGTTNGNLDGYRGVGGGGGNVYAEEGQWENDGQIYGFSGGASSSRM